MRYLTLFILLLLINNPSHAEDYQVGKASWYGVPFHGRKMANGKIYNMHKLTAAHNKLPLGTVVKVTNLKNDRVVTVTITDRGPFKDNRILDLSKGSATQLDMIKSGLADVKIEVVKEYKGKKNMLIAEAIDSDNRDNHMSITYDKEKNEYTVSVFNVVHELFFNDTFVASEDPTLGKGMSMEDRQKSVDIATTLSNKIEIEIENIK